MQTLDLGLPEVRWFQLDSCAKTVILGSVFYAVVTKTQKAEPKTKTAVF